MVIEIKIKNLRVSTCLGIYDYEKKNKREVLMNISIKFDGTRVLKTHKIEDTIDYDTIAGGVKAYCESRNFDLVEEMADLVTDFIMKDRRIDVVNLEIDKAKIFDYLDSFAILITKTRADYDITDR